MSELTALPCVVCGAPTTKPARGRCPTCYDYWYRHGHQDRDPAAPLLERARGCCEQPCLLGCDETPSPGVYTRAAALAAAHAADYAAQGRPLAAARAARAAAGLRAGAEETQRAS